MIAVTCGLGAALEAAAAEPMEDAATEATANESTTRRSAGSVIGRNLATTARFPLSAATAYKSVLRSNQAETAKPNRRNIAVKARSGLVDCNHLPRWEKLTVPRSVDALKKNANAATSHATTQMASA
jgi:hypothetical protein